MAALRFELVAACPTTRARVARMHLPHGITTTPEFMPVATQASMKGITASQLHDLGLSLILNNTYHLSLRPGTDLLTAAGGAHAFQGWTRNLLTDSGGFQMVSLAKLSSVSEEGVQFENPFIPEQQSLLTPEESIRIQHAIGADIIMQLDDVVASTTVGPRVEEASHRSVRWLDRCISEHKKYGKDSTQNLFAIVQGGLDVDLREKCLDEMLKRSDDIPGYAIGGLSGGESKDVFWRIVSQCAQKLPLDKPRYCMGIGYGEDLLVCAALGVDLADCVFPTRTARFGVALTFDGPLNLRLQKYSTDYDVIEKDCPCPTCKKGQGLSRSMLGNIVYKETTGAHAVTLHNLTYQMRLMAGAKEAIIAGTFPAYLKTFFRHFFGDHSQYPEWAVNALRSVNVDLMEDAPPGTKPRADDSGKWDLSEKPPR